MRRITMDSFGGVYGVDERVLRRGDECDQKVIQSILGIFNEIDEQENILQNPQPISSHYIGDRKLFQTFSRDNEREPYRYAGLCEFQDNYNMRPETGRRTFIISQYHAEDSAQLLFNERFTKALARYLVKTYGDIPIAPHLYFPQFMEDTGIEREYGIEAGHLLMRACDSVIVATIDDRISEGMKADIEYATINLALHPDWKNFTQTEAEEFIAETENERYEERNRAEHR